MLTVVEGDAEPLGHVGGPRNAVRFGSRYEHMTLQRRTAA